ncbi:MAG: PEP-CTERM sorting domain-containing protein [Pirellulales bacterium]
MTTPKTWLGIFVTLGTLTLWAAVATPARADISIVNMFRNNTFTQVANGNSLTTGPSFFSASLFPTSPSEYNAVQMIYPGPGSPVNVPAFIPSEYRFQTGFFATQAAMDAAFPTGTYSFNATKASGTDTASFNYAGDAYPQTRPYLDGNSFTDLRTFNPHQPLVLQFSPLVPHPAANPAHVFFSIFEPAANTFAFVASFLPATTTSLTLPANTLQPKRNYIYELSFSDRVVVATPGATFNTQIGFQLRTSASFTTIPEPASLALLATGLGAVALGHLRSRNIKARRT